MDTLLIHVKYGKELATVRTYPAKVRGKIQYVLDFGTRDGQRCRRFYKTAKQAKAAKHAAKNAAALAGRWWATIRDDEKLEMVVLFKQMRDAGVRPADVWEAYSNGDLNGTVRERRTLGEAITETILVKRETNRKERYLSELEQYLWKFAQHREDIPIDQIGPADIDQWFAKRKEGPETRKSNLGRLSSVFGLCERRGYIPFNPCRRSEQVIIDHKPPKILSVEQVERMLTMCREITPEILSYIVLAVLVGIRPEELQKMESSKIDLRQKRVTVDFQASKIRTWRIIELPENALAWLRVCPIVDGKAVPCPSTLRRARRKLRDALGMPEWVQDVLRHTCASHLLATHPGSEARIAAMLGTSARVLHRRYKNGLVTREEGQRFAALAP